MMIAITASSPAPLSTTSAICSCTDPPRSPPTVDSTIITSTTTMSCTIRNPSAIRPWSSSSSRLSDSSLTMMIVDENVSATATYNATVADMPSSRARPNPMIEVNATCPRPVINATLPVVRTRCRSSFSPTRKSRTAMPISANSSIGSVSLTQPSTDGPTRMPTAMNATINGCRARLARNPTPAATASTAAVNVKASPVAIIRSVVRPCGSSSPDGPRSRADLPLGTVDRGRSRSGRRCRHG
jgi:hypothetical protein